MEALGCTQVKQNNKNNCISEGSVSISTCNEHNYKYNSHFEVHVTTMTSLHTAPIKGPHIHTCSAFYLAITANATICVTRMR